MSISAQRIAYSGVVILAALAVVRAAALKYQERERAIRQECSQELQKLGLTRAQAKAKYPTPHISLVSAGCILPGGTGEVIVKGRFVPGTKFVIQNDSFEVLKENLATTEYRATVKLAPNSLPQSASVVAISPVSGISASGSGITTGGRYEWKIDAANGWKIVARSPANKACGGTSVEDSYDVQFFRKGETAPFETRRAKGHYGVYETTEYFTVDQESAATANSQERFTEMVKKMSDPNLPSAEREKLMANLQKAQEQMTADMQKMTDPNYIKKMEAQRKQFGCERMELKPQAAGYAGTMRCSDLVGTRIALTGTLTYLGR